MAQAMGVIGLGSTIAGGMLQAQGAAQSADAKAQSYNYQAGVAEVNKQIAMQNADFARRQGEISAMQSGLKSGQQFGAIRAAQGASGLAINSGSNAEVQKSQRMIGKMDSDMIRSNAAKTAYDYQVQGDNFGHQAVLNRMGASNAEAEGRINVAGSYIGMASSVANRWTQGNQIGLWNTTSNARSGIDLYGPDFNIVGYQA